ncbi:unnamed protein product [Ostreobium quekettii]|uniref:Uncharacterized protein n=1 Tax=Ostreobium quekettii TaxID=121088 RepID=A0A8S1IS74_9CHLO|nr:unnamed protein product [Ostreobium quekettii]|eukprot:evm.model.scf_330.8 EVM.evm.TU.scf_330.8   scf_330:65233-66639(+)
MAGRRPKVMEAHVGLKLFRVAGLIITFIGWVVTIWGLVRVAEDLEDVCNGRQCDELDVYWSYLVYQIFVLLCVGVAEWFGAPEFTVLSLLGLCMVASTVDQWAADIFRTGVECGELAFAGWAVMAAGNIVMIIGLGYKKVEELKTGVGRSNLFLGQSGSGAVRGEPLIVGGGAGAAAEAGAAGANQPPVYEDLPTDFSVGLWVYPVLGVLSLGSLTLSVASARKWCEDFDCEPLKFYWWIVALEGVVLLFVFVMRLLGRLTPWTQAATFLLAMPTTFLAIWAQNFFHLAREDFPDKASLRGAAVGTLLLAVSNYLLAFTLGFHMSTRVLRKPPFWASQVRVIMVALGIAGWVIALIGVTRSQEYLCSDNQDAFDDDLMCDKFRLYWWFFSLEAAVLIMFFVGLFLHLKAGWTAVTLTFAAVAAIWPLLVADEFRVFPAVTAGDRDQRAYQGHLIMSVAFLALVSVELF